jgi:8-oxo-dGTP pyrophosphatase MutT (NUDIX family)
MSTLKQTARRIGMYLSLSLISVAHGLRYWCTPATADVIQGVRVILVDDRRILLVSHWYAPWAWTLPGGGIQRNESPEHAAARETKEETGLTVRSIAGEIGTYLGRWGRGDRVVVYYTGDFEGSLSLKPNLEIKACSWFNIDTLPLEMSPANRRRVEAYRDGVRGERGRW